MSVEITTRDQDITIEAICTERFGAPLMVARSVDDPRIEMMPGDVAVTEFQHCPGYGRRSGYALATDEDGRLGNEIIWVVREDGKIRMTYFNIAGARGKVWNIRRHERTKSRLWKLRTIGGRDDPYGGNNLARSIYLTAWVEFYIPPERRLRTGPQLIRHTTAMTTSKVYREQRGTTRYEGKPHLTSGIAADAIRYAAGDWLAGYSLLDLNVRYR